MLDANIIKEIGQKYKNDPMKERACIAAVISSQARIFGNEMVVVGGSAVEFYTAACYMTKDLDFIAKDNHQLSEMLKSLGFKCDESLIWYHDDTSVIIEIPKGPLAGDLNKAIPVDTEYGTARFIGIEDIILDRLQARVYWSDNNEWPEFMLYAHFDEIDFDYLRAQGEVLLIDKAVEKMIADVTNFKENKTDYLRDTFFSDKEIIDKIIDRLELDDPIVKIIRSLCQDDRVKGKSPNERCIYLREIIKSNKKIKLLVKEAREAKDRSMNT